MNYFIFVLISAISWFFGIFAFAQIIGSLRAGAHYRVLVIWLLLLILASYLMYRYLPKYILAYVIGIVISFFKMLFTPDIQ